MELSDRYGYDTVVLSGGISKGIYQLGCLMYLHEKGMLKEVNTWVGSSVGAVVSLYMVLGIEPMNVYIDIFNVNIDFNIQDVEFLKVLKNWGLFPIEKLTDKVVDSIDNLTNLNINFRTVTFRELFDITGLKLIVVATNIRSHEPEYFHHETHPDMPVMKAVGMSCNIPIFFYKNEYQDSIYTDAGISDNYPLRLVDNGRSRVLGIDVTSQNYDDDNPKTLVQYLYRVVIIPIRRLVKVYTPSDRCHSIKIRERSQDKNYMFNVPKNVKWEMFSHGYQTAIKFYMGKDVGINQ